ncbi:hypothetical protein NITHO_4570004 [Nitrolancea hollandica Lb]|uniref:Uncharacterized protein n=1 Tax=Nitrolancea hollandica Lb TaxID=1129897 RepID=I4EKE0_9BACT|nr:hypothetical protein NITHO_4570004 [Nitrolancea hollandica Lb]
MCDQPPRGGKPTALTGRSQLNLAQEQMILPPARSTLFIWHLCFVILRPGFVILNEVKDLSVRRFFAFTQYGEEWSHSTPCSRLQAVSADGLPPHC